MLYIPGKSIIQNIYHLTRSKFYIWLQQKSRANVGLEILWLQADCRMQILLC